MSTQPGRRRESAAALPGGSTCCQRVGIQLSGYQKSAKGAGRLSRESRLRARRIGWNPIARPDCRVNATTRRPAIAPGGPDRRTAARDGRPAARPAQPGPGPGTWPRPVRWPGGCRPAGRTSARPRPRCAPTVRRQGWPRRPGPRTAGRPRTRRPPRPSHRPAVPAAAPGRPAHREDQLTGNIQAFPAGGQEPQPSALGKQRGHQVRRRLQDVLAVVQHHQQLTAGQRADQPGGRGRRIPLGHAQGLRDAGRDQGRIGKRAQFDQPGAVPEAGLGERRHPQRQPGRAAPAGAGQRDQPAAAEPVTHGSYLGAAAHQRAHLGRQPRLLLRKTCRLHTP